MDLKGPFVYSSTSPRVMFGSGTISQLPDELRCLGATKPLLITSPSRVSLARTIQGVLVSHGITDVEFLDTALVHNPSHVIEAAVGKVAGRDCLVSLGGGSAVGLGKALALRVDGVPHVAVPTTYSGSEMTPIIGETKDGKKVSTTHRRILPAVAIYDVDLTLDLPLKVAAPSGINALAHSIEALYAENKNPVISLIALESIKSLVSGLVRMLTSDSTTSVVEARTSALYGAFLAGMTVASTGIALQHKLAHAAGGTLNLPHAETHAIFLPHSVAYNAVALPDDLVTKVCEAMQGGFGRDKGDNDNGGIGTASKADSGGGGGVQQRERLVAMLNRLNRRLDIPRGLRELGMKEEEIERVAGVAFEKPYWNPRELDREKIREVIRRAWAGEEARADL